MAVLPPKIRAAALCAAMVVSAFPARAVPACGHVPGVGQACRVSGGYAIARADGTVLTTHGIDLVPALLPGFAQPSAPACVADPAEFHLELVYARPSDRADRLATSAPAIRSMAALANGKLREEAARFGRAMDLRFLCADGQPVVRGAVLSTTERETSFSTVALDLADAGFASQTAKYVVWFDGRPPGAGGGTGSITSDDRASLHNTNNFGPSYAVNWGIGGDSGAFVFLHEISHTFGAVQLSAPHSTGGWHCTDGGDVMCYNDNGPRGNEYSPSVCATMAYDCNNDDYFHPAPPSGHRLTTSWNVGSPYNRFVTGCTYRAGTFYGAGAAPLEGVVGRTYPIPAACAGGWFALGAHSRTLTSSDSRAREVVGFADVDVCWLRGSEIVRCDVAPGVDSGFVPAGTDGARITFKAGTDVAYALNVV